MAGVIIQTLTRTLPVIVRSSLTLSRGYWISFRQKKSLLFSENSESIQKTEMDICIHSPIRQAQSVMY